MELTGLQTDKEFKWRASMKYNLLKSPYQKYGPWKYYSNYIPVPNGAFRTKIIPPAEKQLTLTCFIQGLYNLAGHSMIQDTATVYIRAPYSPYPKVDSAKAFLSSSGNAVFTFNNTVNNFNIYVDVKHRNSVEAWSAVLNKFTSSAFTFNLSSNFSQAYGNNMIVVDASPVRYAMYSGDADQNGYVNLNDVTLIFNDANNYITGYVKTDLTGDNIVSLSDILLAYNNSNNYVSVIRP